jgi:4-amino-4-deoxy-L-arabinose transferase-like glycosyltransferase
MPSCRGSTVPSALTNPSWSIGCSSSGCGSSAPRSSRRGCLRSLPSPWPRSRRPGSRAASGCAEILPSSLAWLLPRRPCRQVMGRAATADALVARMHYGLRLVQWRIATREKASFALHLGVWTTLGLAFLTKGPPALVGPAALGLGLLSERRKLHVRACSWAFLWALALVLAWAIPALVRSDGRYWTEGVMHHVVERSLLRSRGMGALRLGGISSTSRRCRSRSCPAAPFSCASSGGMKGEDPIPRHRALWIWVLGTLLVFTLATSKLPHYPMPAFPALAILAAAACSPRHVHRADRWIAGLFIVLGLALPV